MKQIILLCLCTCLFFISLSSQTKKEICVTGYYAGNTSRLDSFAISKLTHLIYSFGHLNGNQLHITDSDGVRKMVSLKKKNPSLKIILSMGGWSGCAECSPVFSSMKGRTDFAVSVKKYLQYFQADGIDLDWEYPGIAGFPGHAFSSQDKPNFTSLVAILRKTLGKKYEISFAAGGFDSFIDSSIEWQRVMNIADKVYVMSYDLVHGYSKISGHHTPLYSTPEQLQSADHAIKRLIDLGVPSTKIVIGAAFYGRYFQLTDTLNHGLYRPCVFSHAVSYSSLRDSLAPSKGFHIYRDEVAKAPYAFHPERKLLLTYDDSTSITKKMEYVINNNLGGIMFWQLADDRLKNGLLDVMDRVKTHKSIRESIRGK